MAKNVQYSAGNRSTPDDDDVSKYPFPNTIWTRKEDWEIAVKTSVVVPVVIVGVLGNVALLHAIFRCRTLRTPTNLLIANMAAADLFQLLFCTWMFLLNDFFQNYILGSFGCKIEGFLECSLLLTSVMNLCAVSYDRLTAIVLPSQSRITRTGATIIMAVTWAIGLLLGIPLIVFRRYKARQWANFNERYCKEVGTFLPIYWHILLAFIVWLPLLNMLICYTAIFIKLEKYKQKVLKRENPISVKYKTKVARTVFIVVVTFIICRIPFTALIFLRGNMLPQQNQFNGKLRTLLFCSKFVIYVNAALNPIIYGLTNDNFRRAFRSTPFCKWMCRRKAPPTPPTRQIFVGVLEPRRDKDHDSGAKLFAVSWIRPPLKMNLRQHAIEKAAPSPEGISN